MKTKKQLKRDLIILKKKKADLCFVMEADYKVLKRRLKETYKLDLTFTDAVQEASLRKRFRKAVAKKLGVKYGLIKDQFPANLNSTSIANYLEPHLEGWSRQEIRSVCQEVKLKIGFT